LRGRPPTAGAVVIAEHDEDDPSADQELFLVLRGHAVFEVDGDRVDAPAGMLVFAPSRTKRTATANEDGTPAGHVTRSITFGRLLRCPRSSAVPQCTTPTSIRSATNRRSGN
jgi:hypothetical protein